MKFLVLSCVVIAVLAEPPRFRPARFRFQRIELAPTTTDSPTEATTTEISGPYPASGWKPAGEPFTLPNEEKQPADQYGPPDAPYPPSGWKPQGQAFELPKEAPANSYGAPDNTYGAPANTYGAPANTYGAPDSTDAPSTDNPQAERLEGPVEVQKSIGTYFVLLPNGQLQKVEFVTENDIQNMKYTARLQLRNPAPLLVFRP
ncbi:unnamed protein product [Arctia plantaginis]|uniref:DUF4794 domain-containing protein n=1 Tax=Arctia plantaginis TaxID=874455 RepID=A0A8S1AME5_ARCPL|nr:unnamed protein product [Arctia plantaginis]